MRVAHFSDIHVARAPMADLLGLFHPKRALGAVNHYLAGRGRHFAGSGERIARLLDDVDAQGVDHALCTGDVTMMSYEQEFAEVAALYGPRLERPDRHTIIPGNHDRYTQAAHDEKRFERFFGRIAPVAYPFVKRIGPGVVVVGIDVSRPTGIDSRGFCGDVQREALASMLTDRSLSRDFVILALHYGLYRSSGIPDWPSHRLIDYRPLVALIDRDDVRVDLVVHGHIHKHYAVRTERRAVVCAGSATDLAVRCGYNLYDIDVDRRTFTVTRRSWDERAGAYGPEMGTP
ncbi:metallophosphoesterase [Myxococcota bacterium]|nr:metallophosphoesterase [Myxococcota bacterium]